MGEYVSTQTLVRIVLEQPCTASSLSRESIFFEMTRGTRLHTDMAVVYRELTGKSVDFVFVDHEDKVRTGHGSYIGEEVQSSPVLLKLDVHVQAVHYLHVLINVWINRVTQWVGVFYPPVCSPTG